MDELITLAVEAARAGARAVRARVSHVGAVRHKSNAFDLVTDADVSSGIAICETIARRLPGARFVVEERPVYESAHVVEGSLDDSEVWVIDPLDGTTSFVHGYPCYATSVALVRDGIPVVGAVHDIPADRTCYAAAGHGAFLEGDPIRVSDRASLNAALVITGFPYDRGSVLDAQMAALARVVRDAEGIRRDGSAALDCCHVAAGRADGFWEFDLKPWDMAAGVVILKEAGARTSGIDGAPWTLRSTGIITATPRVFDALASRVLDR